MRSRLDRRWSLLCAAATLFGCGEVLDLDAYDNVGSAAAGTAGSGGSGAAGGGAVGGGGGGGGTSSGGAAACGPGSIAELIDDFDDDLRDVGRWSVEEDSLTAALETNQQVELDLYPGTQSRAAAYASFSTYSFEDCGATIELVQAPQSADPAQAFFQAEFASGVVLELDVTGGILTATVNLNGMPVSSSSQSYSPTQHRWLRIGIANGTATFNAGSIPGEGMTLLHEYAYTFSADGGRLRFGGTAFGSTMTRLTVIFDNVNIGGAN